jgi:sugar/nucleoside kinase (ribokinase family)
MRSRAVDIVGLGLATVDVMTLVPRLPGLDEVFPARRILLEGGGPVATALVTASRLGASTAYLGPIAPTTWGALTRAGLEAQGVDTSHAPGREDGEQSSAVILVDEPSGQRSILYERGDLQDLAPAEVPAGLITVARALHLDGVHPEAACHAAEVARQAGVVVSFDGGAGVAWDGTERLLSLVDLMVVARRFAEQVTGLADPLEAGPALLETCEPRQVVITDGLQGSWCWEWVQGAAVDRSGSMLIHQPAFAVDVVDTTGAGDVYHGAYLYAYLQGWPVQRCLAFAAATAALKCKVLGGRAGIPTHSQVEKALEERS